MAMHAMRFTMLVAPSVHGAALVQEGYCATSSSWNISCSCKHSSTESAANTASLFAQKTTECANVQMDSAENRPVS